MSAIVVLIQLITLVSTVVVLPAVEYNTGLSDLTAWGVADSCCYRATVR